MAFGVNIVPLTRPTPVQPPNREVGHSKFLSQPIGEEQLRKALSNLDISALDLFDVYNHAPEAESLVFPALDTDDDELRVLQSCSQNESSDFNMDYAFDFINSEFLIDPIQDGAALSFQDLHFEIPSGSDKFMDSPIEDETFTQLLGTTIEELDQTLFGMPFDEFRAQQQALQASGQ